MPFLVPDSSSQREHSAASDRELLERLRGGDERALDELVERKARPLLQLARRILGDSEEARDVVQLTFIRAWQNREKFNRRWSPNTWLYRIATNLAIDCLRARTTRHRAARPLRSHLFRVIEGRAAADLARLGHREVVRILRELAAGLTERQRLVFLLRELEGLSSREVAEILGCRASTVRNHLFTARKHLREELKRRYPEYAREEAP